MHHDPTLHILAAAFIGALIGFFGASLMASVKFRRIEKDTWNCARKFYDHKQEEI
jgi:hypothetical protein